MNTQEKTPQAKIADRNIAILYTYNPDVNYYPEIIQSFIKQCFHHVAIDVMCEQPLYQGQARNHVQWAERHIAHVLGALEELMAWISELTDTQVTVDDILPEKIRKAIKNQMYKTSMYADQKYTKMLQELDN